MSSPAPAPSSPKSPASPARADPAAQPEVAASPPPAPEAAETGSGALPAAYWAQQPMPEEQDEADSAYGDVASATTSITSSILAYRTIHGRTYHSDRSPTAEYWGPNDEQGSQCMDTMHHLLTLVLDGKLYRAPLDPKKVKNVLDVGTGTGIWAVDFGDLHPDAEVVGFDISPMQTTWVPPNVYFEHEDMTQPWVYADNSYDFVHMRYLFGAVADWDALFQQAYRVCKPGGWVESFEADALLFSDDGTILENTPMDQWGKLFSEAGKKMGRSFLVVNEDLQRKGLEAAGFTNLNQWDFKCPITPWPRDPKLKQLGEYSYYSLQDDLEGMVLYVFTTILGWSAIETQVFLAHMRRQLKDMNVHVLCKLRCIYAQKPEDAPAS